MMKPRSSAASAPFLALLVVLCVLPACAPKTGEPIRDLAVMPQDAGAYHALSADRELLSPPQQAGLYADFLRRHFEPWEREKAATPPEWAFWALESFRAGKVYGENTLARDTAWLKRMERLSRPEQYPSMARPAVTLRATSMRALPTQEPVFKDFELAGEGFPFDYNQNSLVPAGTPVHAVHESADGRFLLVECRFAFGWVPMRDIAFADREFMRRFRTQSMAAFVRDRVSVRDASGIYRFTAGVGTVLPLERFADSEQLMALVPIRMPSGFAAAVPAPLPEGSAVPQPLATTPENFARIGNAMAGRPYGWGGLYENRDCSALTMDFMTPFGIFLPRNSGSQASHGDFYPLEDMTAGRKKAFIANAAVPFLTLVRSPGHIMLYIGNFEGEPAVLHATWGIKTERFGKEGRLVVGRAVVTTLSPGEERRDVPKPLIESVQGITFLAPREIRP
jgi:cell wall-associated NlpC family hydrolase